MQEHSTRLQRRPLARRLGRPLLAALAALAVGVAIAAAPGPTAIGEFYYYYDASGNQVGYRAIRCDGTYVAWGKTSTRYSNGYALCLPRD